MQRELKAYLEEIAAEGCWADEDDYVNPFENSGGNFDDAYYGGIDTGRVTLARRLLEKFGG